jgi:hypothetical protein
MNIENPPTGQEKDNKIPERIERKSGFFKKFIKFIYGNFFVGSSNLILCKIFNFI